MGDGIALPDRWGSTDCVPPGLGFCSMLVAAGGGVLGGGVPGPLPHCTTRRGLTARVLCT